MKPYSFVIVLLSGILLGAAVYAQDTRPNVPYVQRDICPFECCQYGQWTARSPLKVYKQEGDSSVIAFTIKPGEQFTALRGNVHITKLGISIIRKSFDQFIAGDKVYILSYRGEGAYDLWYKGKEIDLDLNKLEELWTNSESLQEPKMTWWVLIETKHGKRGWLKLINISEGGFRTEEQIEGRDSCS